MFNLDLNYLSFCHQLPFLDHAMSVKLVIVEQIIIEIDKQEWVRECF